MYARRSPFRLLLLVGLGVLLGAALFGGSEAAGAVIAAPLVIFGFMFKVALFLLLFGFLAKAFGGRHREHGDRSRWASEARDWQRRHGGEFEARRESNDFEEWHRMAHARQEVDEHTPPVED